jgi:pimeloyl-ACP methyl ester carboxylesterase
VAEGVTLESGFVQAGDLTLHHMQGGSGEPPVLFVHGLGSSGSLEWRFNLPALARSRRVLAPDLPGFGRSEKPPLRYGLPVFEAAVHDYVRAVRAERIDVVGASMGGRIAIGFTLAHPRMVRRLVLVNSLGLGMPRTASFYQLVAAPMLGEVVLLGVRRAIHGLPPPLVRRAAGRSVGMSVDPEQALGGGYLSELREMHAAEGFHQAYLATVRSLARGRGAGAADLTKELAAVGTPVLLVWGADDPLFPLGIARRAHRVLPGSALAVIKGAGHTPQAEHPHEFNQVVASFLDA